MGENGCLENVSQKTFDKASEVCAMYDRVSFLPPPPISSSLRAYLTSPTRELRKCFFHRGIHTTRNQRDSHQRNEIVALRVTREESRYVGAGGCVWERWARALSFSHRVHFQRFHPHSESPRSEKNSIPTGTARLRKNTFIIIYLSKLPLRRLDF